MFSIINVLANQNTTIRVSYKERTIEFIVSAIINSKGKPRIDPDYQFDILNAYLDYKGDSYKETMFNTLEKSKELIMDTIEYSGIDPLPYEAINILIDLLDLEDILYFIKHEFKLRPPKNLKDTFDNMLEEDGRESRVQTYLKEDYLDLAVLITVFKVTAGPICMYAYIKQNELSNNTKEYLLVHFYKHNAKLKTYPPMIKLFGFTDELLSRAENENQEDRKRILEKGIPLEEMSTYLTAITIMHKLLSATLVDDNENNNVVNKMYNYINTRLKTTNNSSKVIRDKDAMADLDSTSGDKESIVESLRVIGDIAPGMAIELDWAINTIDKILNQLPEDMRKVINLEVLKDAELFTKEFLNAEVARCNLEFLAIIFKSIMDPRGIDYIRLNSVINLIAVGFSYLWSLGFKQLAVLVASKPMLDIEDVININTTVNKPRVPQELKDELNILFPYRKIVSRDTTENVAEKALYELAKAYEVKNWKTTAFDKYKQDGPIIPIDLRTQLIEFVIKNERMTYGQYKNT